MKSKTADLAAGLVAVKGSAVPSPDMPGRAGGPALAPVPAVSAPSPAPAIPSPEAAERTSVRKANRKPAQEKEANLAPLNFRISASFRREFRTYAATHDLKLNELLRLSFESYRRQHRD
jgi:hypothetical protein